MDINDFYEVVYSWPFYMKNNNLRLCEDIKEVVFESFENGKIEKRNVKKK